jgi:2-phospho-L-lactate guanylyltransferase
MNWIALVPLKEVGQRKSRLAPLLDADARTALAGALAARLFATLAKVGVIGIVRVLSPAPDLDSAAEWVRDEGTGINRELARARLAYDNAPLLVINADLPFIEVEDIVALLAAAEGSGVAIAPDRHSRGTNAIALATPEPFDFRFGTDSLGKHRLGCPQAALVSRLGLAFDIDVPDDLVAARQHPAGAWLPSRSGGTG